MLECFGKFLVIVMVAASGLLNVYFCVTLITRKNFDKINVTMKLACKLRQRLMPCQFITLQAKTLNFLNEIATIIMIPMATKKATSHRRINTTLIDATQTWLTYYIHIIHTISPMMSSQKKHGKGIKFQRHPRSQGVLFQRRNS